MQKISRKPLDAAAVDALGEATRTVASAADPTNEAKRLWKNLGPSVRSEIQSVLRAMSTGHERCMYCEDSAGTDIEHYWPKDRYPHRAFLWENYLNACSRCNSNYKRSEFPLDADGAPLLLDPTVDNPVRHLTLTPSTGAYESQDERGQATIRVCGLNRAECAQGRSDAWMALTVLISTYADWKVRGRHADAERVLRVIDKYPFQSVRLHMVRVFEEAADPTLLLSLEVIEAFGRFAELLGRGAVEEDAAE